MATMNFSVPDDVRAAFNKAFAGTNKSALLTELMRQAVEDRQRQKRRARAISQLLELQPAPQAGQPSPDRESEAKPASVTALAVDASVALKWAFPHRDGEAHVGQAPCAG
jgi:hypothetical protein